MTRQSTPVASAPSRREVLQRRRGGRRGGGDLGLSRRRQAALAASPVVRGYGVTTSQLKDWSIMEKSIGMQMEFTGTNADIGVFMRDVISTTSARPTTSSSSTAAPRTCWGRRATTPR